MHENGNAFAMVLPAVKGLKKFEDAKNLCIEFYFDIDSLNTKVDGKGLELEPQTIIEKCRGIEVGRRTPDINTELHYYKPNKNTKAYFAEKVVPTLSDDKFCNFKILFGQVLEIINIKNKTRSLAGECAVSLEDS